jgi:hypothetical protein
LRDVFRQFQRDLHGDVLQSIISSHGGFGHSCLKSDILLSLQTCLRR